MGFSVVSLSLGNPAFPFGNRSIRNMQRHCKLFLREPFFFADGSDERARFFILLHGTLRFLSAGHPARCDSPCAKHTRKCALWQPTLRRVEQNSPESGENRHVSRRRRRAGSRLLSFFSGDAVEQGNEAPDDDDDSENADHALEHDGQRDGKGFRIPRKHMHTSLQQVFDEGNDQAARDDGSDLA